MKETNTFDRKALGARLRAFREKKGLTAYRVAKQGDIRRDQVKTIEEGGTNYTIDAFLGYLKGCDLRLEFTEKPPL